MESLNIQIQHKLIEELTNKNSNLKFINSFAELIQNCDESNQIIEIINQSLKAYFPSSFFDIFLLNANDCFINDLVKPVEIEDLVYANGNNKPYIQDNELVLKVANSGIAVLTNSSEKSLSTTSKINSQIAVPLLLNKEKTIGVLCSHHSQKDFFSKEHQNMLITVGSMAASKLMQIWHLEKIKKYQNQLEDYVHIVSHDLKSPLRSIDALANWVKEDNINTLDKGSIKNLDLILNTVHNMDRLIVDVLTYSKLDYLVNDYENVDIQSTVLQVIKSVYSPEHVSINIIDEMPVIKGNKTKFNQIFQNLIVNAIAAIDKPLGEINIGCKTFEDHYEFSISDNGVGIDKKYFEKIFKVFQSLDEQKKSSGVGLSIVKKIVNNYGGRVWLESKKDEFTTFFFTFPKQPK